MNALASSAHEVEADPIEVLNYGEVLEVQGIACTVEFSTGITCTLEGEWMAHSGEGYEFSTENPLSKDNNWRFASAKLC